MKTNRVLNIVFAVILVSGAAAPLARADRSDQVTQLTFNQPIQIHGQVLPAGTYWFVLDRNSSNRGIVRIFSSDWKKLYATAQTISAERKQVADRTALTFAEQESSLALITWFYPGELIGHEFLYSKAESMELAGARQLTIFGCL